MKNICLPSQHTQCLPKAYFGSFGSEMCDQAPMIYHWGASNATDFHTGTDHQSVYHLAIPMYIYYSYPQQDGKVIHHQISRDLLIYLFGDEHTCFPTWPCEVSITIHIGDMVVNCNIWLIELKPPIYLSSNRPKIIIFPDSSPFTHHFPWVFFNFPSIPLIFPPFSHHFPTIFPPFLVTGSQSQVTTPEPQIPDVLVFERGCSSAQRLVVLANFHQNSGSGGWGGRGFCRFAMEPQTSRG